MKIYSLGDSTSGQRGLYEVGLTGIPMYNVNNNCATGSTALLLAKQLIEAGSSNCVLAVGFEKMKPGSLGDTPVMINFNYDKKRSQIND